MVESKMRLHSIALDKNGIIIASRPFETGDAQLLRDAESHLGEGFRHGEHFTVLSGVQFVHDLAPGQGAEFRSTRDNQLMDDAGELFAFAVYPR